MLESSHGYLFRLSPGGAPRPIGRMKAAGLLLAVVATVAASFLIAAPAGAADDKTYGKPGDPIDLTVGYQPYYTESWSGLIMRGKQFYEKYLPKGSTVNFQVGLQGAIIVNQMIAGKQDIGYAGDMPSIVATSKSDIRDLRLVSTLGLGYDPVSYTHLDVYKRQH